MKRVLFLLFTSISFQAMSQVLDSLQTSVLNVKISSGSALFMNPVNSTGAFHADELSVIFASNFWFAGEDFNGMLHASADTYGYTHDFQMGPVMLNFNDYAITTQQFNRLWKVTRNEVYWHQTHFTQPGYIAPQSIIDWPGNAPAGAVGGNDLAPYYDYNLDGFYNPYDGDFPLIKGDEAIYFVRNDDTIHASTGASPSMLEVHYMLYVFNCSPDSVLQRTVFADIKVFSRGTTLLNNAYMGIWTDLDIGYSGDDYIGTNVEKGMYYAYNGDDFDETTFGIQGYDSLTPACGVLFLGGPFADADGIDNPLSNNMTDCIDSLGIPYPDLGIAYSDYVPDNERLGLTNTFAGSFGQNSNELYQALRSIWLDNSHLMFGGDGNQSSTGAQNNGLVECNYIYPGDSDPLLWGTRGVSVTNPNTWTETAAGSIPADQRMVGSCGPLTYTSGEYNELNIAYIYARV